jgi:hypothetical protein
MKNKRLRNKIFYLLIFTTTLLLAGCQPGFSAATESPEALFVAPTLNPAENFAAIPATPLPTRQIACQDQLKFKDDLTIPDGTEVVAGATIVKRWLIENTGSCNWNQAYSFQLISGLALGAETNQRLYPARQNTEAVLEVIFSAPDNPGRYNTWWQAHDPDGNRFGDPVYMDIEVTDGEE